MNDQWVPGPPPAPPPPPGDPLPPANSWNPAEGCSVGPSQPSIVDSIILTGVPATITAMPWSIILNDGQSPPNFGIAHYDGSGALIDHPMAISGVDGSVTFNDSVFVNASMQVTGNLVVPGTLMLPDPSHFNLPGGTSGQVLTATGSGGFVQWQNPPPPAIGVDAPTDGYLYGRTQGVWAPGGTFSQPLYLQGSNMLALVGPPGASRGILGGTGTAIPPPASINWRWQMLLGDTTAESGSSAGSNFALNPISDTGAIMSPSAFAISRASGQATFNYPLSINAPVGNTQSLQINKRAGGAAAIMGASNTGLPRWQLSLANVNAELGNNLGSNFELASFADNGATIGIPLSIARSSGMATWNYGITVNGVSAFNNVVLFSNVGNLSVPGGNPGEVLTTNGSGVLYWSAGGSGGGIQEAPLDGATYARNNAAWVHLTHADITDWTATLAPYALTANVPIGSSTTPLMNGTAAVGTGVTWARADHVHPTDTSRYAASNPSGYQTAAQVTAVLPVASSTTPLMDGTAAIGNATTWARANHVHPSDTSRLALAGGTLTGTLNGTIAIFSSNVSASGIYVNTPAGTPHGFVGMSASSNRWTMLLGEGSAETGANAGANYVLQSASDAGTALENPFSIARATGIATFAHPIVNGSDRRIKENVQPIEGALASVLRLQGVSYSRLGRAKAEIGLIAQDVLPIVPEVVHETAAPLIDGVQLQDEAGEPWLGISYAQLTALLIEAVKELSAEVDALKLQAAPHG